jgi:adenylate cyclase
MFSLTVLKTDREVLKKNFSNEKIVVGRDENCDLRLFHSLISRNHFQLRREGKRHVVKDLSSRNGTWVNGRRIQNRKEIRVGDIIQVGPYRLLFRPDAPSSTEVQITNETESKTISEEISTGTRREEVVEPLGIISSYISETTGAHERVPTKLRRERISRNLLTLYRITEELVSPDKDLDEILDYVMDEIFEIFSPARATVLLRDQDNPPIPAKQRTAEGHKDLNPISNTIVNRILQDRVSILTDDALQDPRFNKGESVIIDGIRSAMAAPIWEGRTILGLVYVDRLDVQGGYHSEDLDLLTAMGHQVALAIQRRRLTEKLREQAVSNAVIRQNLSRFHSSQVVDLILEGAADLETKEAVPTIFFCDIVHFTEICEKALPRQLQDILNLFCKTVNEIVFDEQGTLDKFIGDAAMIIFGAPLPQADAPFRAIRSALRIRETLTNSMFMLSPELRFHVRYGINTGHAIVGNFGSDERMEYTVLGNAVNLASRISESAGPDQILIGHSTYEAIRDKGVFDIRKAGSKRFKGIRGRKKLFEIKDML